MKLIKMMRPKMINGLSISHGLFCCGKCGVSVEKRLSNGRRDKSCGCCKEKHKTKHGDNASRLYSIWEGIKQRCLNRNNKAYKWYGGRGIKVCKEWMEYKPFKEWATGLYDDKSEIDRKDNDGDYCPANCRFVSHRVNMQNSRAAKLNFDDAAEIRKLYGTGKYTIRLIAKKYNVSSMPISNIIYGVSWN